MSTAKRLVLSLRGRKQSQDSSIGRLVNTGNTNIIGGKDHITDAHELDEIAVVSNADPCQVKYGSGSLGLSTINGPRLVPGDYV